MQTVAIFGARERSEEFEENLTIKHSMSDSSTVSAMMEMEIQSEVLPSEIVSDPL